MGTFLTEEAYREEVERFTKTLVPQEKHATVLTLSGELGAGKTTFVRSLGETLGVAEHITSPTFVLMKTYPLSGVESQGFSTLVHVDAYRLKDGEELETLGLSDYLHNPHCLILLEWPERGAGTMHATHKISIQVEEDGARTISYE